MDSLQVTEDAAAAVAVAPRVTKQIIEDNIEIKFFCQGGAFVAAAEGPDDLQHEFDHHTICLLRCVNGFSVNGHSAPMSPENFDVGLGRQLAYEDAFRKLWPLFAFAALQGADLEKYV